MAYEQVTIPIPHHQVRELREIAEREGVSLGQVIREAVAGALQHEAPAPASEAQRRSPPMLREVAR